MLSERVLLVILFCNLQIYKARRGEGKDRAREPRYCPDVLLHVIVRCWHVRMAAGSWTLFDEVADERVATYRHQLVIGRTNTYPLVKK